MTGQKTWAVGEEVLAADFNNLVQTQVVAQFPNVAARDAWAGPPNGALCVTTDTNTVWQRSGGVWVGIKPYNTAWGEVARVTATGNGPLTAAVEMTVNTAAWTAVAGRRYRVRSRIWVVEGAALGTMTGRIHDGTAVIEQSAIIVAANTQTIIDTEVEVTPSAGAQSYTHRILSNQSANLAGAATQRHFLVVDDVGPVTQI
jgi:hypothetical protein